VESLDEPLNSRWTHALFATKEKKLGKFLCYSTFPTQIEWKETIYSRVLLFKLGQNMRIMAYECVLFSFCNQNIVAALLEYCNSHALQLHWIGELRTIFLCRPATIKVGGCTCELLPRPS
jgi:hypothetical protein